MHDFCWIIYSTIVHFPEEEDERRADEPRTPRVNRNSARDRMDAIPHLCDVVRTLSEACKPIRSKTRCFDPSHKTHTNNLTFIEMARANFVTVICLPLHCSHRMQPLDASFMKLLMTCYIQAAEFWLRSHPGRVVSTFRKTGIWSIDRNVFDEHDFAAAQPTDLGRQPPPDRDTDAPPPDRDTVMSASSPTHQQAPHIAISVGSPVPKINQATVRKATKRGKTCIITDSPYKTALEAKGKLVTCPQPSSSSSKKGGHPKADKTSKTNKK